MQRDVLAHPVVRLERGLAGDLVQVERRAVREHRDVDRLPRVGRELAADRAGLLHHVEPGGGGPGQPEHADAEAVLAAVLVLLDHAVRLQRRHQPERGALVHAQLAGDLGDAGLPQPCEDAQDGQCPVDGLDARSGLGGRGGGVRHSPTVAHLCCVSQYVSRLTQRSRPEYNPGMTAAPASFVLTLDCPDRPGIVHAVSGLLVEHRGNILESQQFDDLAEGRFFMRVRFAVEGDATVDSLRAAFAPVAERFAMTWELWPADAPYRTLILVSKFSHCLNDLLFRWSKESLQIDVVGVVSNHLDCEPLATSYGVPYHHVPVTPETKADAEAADARAGRRARRRPGGAGALHAGALRRHLPRAVGQGDQHPPLVPAELQGRPALPPGLRPRREAGRRHRALRDRATSTRARSSSRT